MTVLTTPIGPQLTFERAKTQPVTFAFVDGGGVAIDLTGKTLIMRVGALGSTALYELELAAVGDPTDGVAGGDVDADIAPSKAYEYHVEDVDSDRILVRGPCTIRAVIAPAS